MREIISIAPWTRRHRYSCDTSLQDTRLKRKSARKLASEYVPTFLTDSTIPYSDHVVQEISTDRRKPEHGLTPKQLKWEYTFVPAARRRPTLSRTKDRVSDFRDKTRTPHAAFQFSHLSDIAR